MFADEDDSTLLKKSREGDERAFEALFHRYYDVIHAFVYRLSFDAATTEDITQESFIKAARSLSSFRQEASFKSWLYRIAVNTSCDWNRRKLRSDQVANALSLEAIEKESARLVDFDPLRAALSALTEEMRQAIVLIYFEGMNHAQAAGILGCAETTVSWRIFRAKRKLKHLLTSSPEVMSL